MNGRPSWRPTSSHLRAGAGGIVLAVGAATLGRPDLLVLATPLLVIAAWAVVRRPSGAPSFEATLEHRTVREGEATTWCAVAGDAAGIDQIATTLGTDPAWRLRPDLGALVDAGDPDGRGASAAIVVASVRWGRRSVGPAAIAVESVWGAFRCGPHRLDAPVLTTLPLPAPFDQAAPIPDPRGLIGAHRSRRQGDGTEFASIRPFTVGDRLRRVNWPVSLRTGELHVSASHVDVDTQLMLVIDASSDVGEHGPFDGRASSLDRSVRAAGTLAEHFLRRGDRVGVRTAAAPRALRLPVGAGQSHLRRLLHELALVESSGGSWQRTPPRPLHIAPGGIVIVLTPLLSPSAFDQAAYLARRHPTVLVIDTLPDDIAAQSGDPAVALAWRIRLLERWADIRGLQHEGVPVVPWSGPGSLDPVLRDLARRAGAPRLVVR